MDYFRAKKEHEAFKRYEREIFGFRPLDGRHPEDRIILSPDPYTTLVNTSVVNLFTPVLGFGICTYLLHNAKIVTVRDLINRNEQDLLEIRGIGKRTVENIKLALNDWGLELGMGQFLPVPEKTQQKPRDIGPVLQ